MAGDILKGTVKWWDNRRGWGYVTGEDGREFFCHYSHIDSDHEFRKLGKDWEVVFTLVTTEKGTMVDWCKVTKAVYPDKKEELTNEHPER